MLSLDKISSTNPRVIDDARARQLCSDVRRCTYYETCATYGLNVNRVFTDGMYRCQNDYMEKTAAEIFLFCGANFFVPQLLRRS